jgi:hypothetical protein
VKLKDTMARLAPELFGHQAKGKPRQRRDRHSQRQGRDDDYNDMHL